MKATITVHPAYRIGEVDRRLYGAFLEPIGNWVYGGIWNPKHPTADDMGFRRDMIDAVKRLGIPAIRLPGGNFMSGWEWKDSIGPLEQRKKHLDMAWKQIEPNVMGHDEYLEWARRAGIDPLYTLNLGTGSVLDAIHCVEYTNYPGGTYWSDLRRQNGHAEPYGVKTWCLGNEMDGPWQIGSYEKDPHAYGVKANEIAKTIKWIDKDQETVVCGTCTPLLTSYPDWNVQVLSECYENADYLSLHYYHNAPEGDIGAYLNASTVFEEFLNTCISACDYVQAQLRETRKMKIAFDEYGFSMVRARELKPGRARHIPHETYTEFSPAHLKRGFRVNDPERFHPADEVQTPAMLKALSQASVLLMLLRHADRVKIGCMTTGIGDGIAYDSGHVWEQATYYPYLHLIQMGMGTSIRPAVDSPTYDAAGYHLDEFMQMKGYENVPFIEAACVFNEEKRQAAVFIINRSPQDTIEISLDARGFEGYRLAEHIEMTAAGLDDANTFENPGAIRPSVNRETSCDGGNIMLAAKPLSWNVVKLTKE